MGEILRAHHPDVLWKHDTTDSRLKSPELIQGLLVSKSFHFSQASQ